MSDPHFDDELLKHVPRELHAEFRRTQSEPKRRKPPDLDPRPPAEREDTRKRIAPGIYTEPYPSEEALARRLGESFTIWEAMGRPASGPQVEELTAALADAYALSAPGGEFETMVAELAVDIGAEHVVNEAAEAFNQMAANVDHYRRGMAAVEELWTKPETPLDAEVDRRLTESYWQDPEYLQLIADGQVDADTIRDHLAERRAVIEEIVLADRRYAHLSAEDEELLRHGPHEEAGMERYREELRQSTFEAVTPGEEDVVQRKQTLLGERQAAEQAAAQAAEEAEMDELRRMGAVVDPEADERQMRWGREAAEAERVSGDG